MKTHLLLIDPQNDFCDLPVDWLPRSPVTGELIQPALPVAGAHADLQRAAGLVERLRGQIDAITVTLDSHHRIDIAHPGFWLETASGRHPGPFTPITAAQVRCGEYLPRDPAHLDRALAYLDALEAAGRYTLMVWPVHCQMGNWGHGVHAGLQAALDAWADREGRSVAVVTKGENPWTEHYSALQAEVPDPSDESTALNQALLAELDRFDRVLIAGEAGSHCVRATVEHLADHLPSRQLAKLVLLTDCISPVAGFEAQQAGFLAAMRARSLQLSTSTEIQA
ncbi:cysteine hydrolase family protein [Pelomonas sp. Root1237]|uniref:cysteine hydrolase family protein n=1 Tax=Pelomonas sp. Root1237 TaxID=1736434 RepID=UPI0006F3EF6D|nr:cysteine hydrolase family protein [Pelomonas sp. Root1237]KQV92108.1 cysteine hydrolase [Pelomonas sp. Root1237]